MVTAGGCSFYYYVVVVFGHVLKLYMLYYYYTTRNGSTSESSGRRYLQQNSDTLATNANISSRETEEDLEEHPVEHLVRRRSDRHHTNIFSIVPLPESGPYSNKLRNDDVGKFLYHRSVIWQVIVMSMLNFKSK